MIVMWSYNGIIITLADWTSYDASESPCPVRYTDIIHVHKLFSLFNDQTVSNLLKTGDSDAVLAAS